MTSDLISYSLPTVRMIYSLVTDHREQLDRFYTLQEQEYVFVSEASNHPSIYLSGHSVTKGLGCGGVALSSALWVKECVHPGYFCYKSVRDGETYMHCVDLKCCTYKTKNHTLFKFTPPSLQGNHCVHFLQCGAFGPVAFVLLQCSLDFIHCVQIHKPSNLNFTLVKSTETNLSKSGEKGDGCDEIMAKKKPTLAHITCHISGLSD